MAPRSFLLCILCTIGFIPSLITALNVSLGFAREPPRTLVATKGRSVVLPCEPSGSPPDPGRVVSWTLDGVTLSLLNTDAIADGTTSIQDTRRTIMQDGSLFIKKILHRTGPGNSNNNNNNAAATANPSEGGGGTVVPATVPAMSDQGVYQCTIANSVGAILSRASRLRVATLPSSFSESPQDVSVEAGDAARLSCHIDAVPQASIAWEKDRETLPQDKRYQVLPSGVLLINNVQERDVGNYKCIATNPHLNKKRHSAEASLSLRPPTKQYRPPQLLGAVPSPPAPSAAPDKKPEPTVIMKNIEVLQGEMLSLECAASGYPTPQLVWSVLFPGQTQEEPLKAPKLYGVNVLHIPNIEATYSGMYICAAVNHKTEESPPVVVKQVYNVTVLVPPFFIKAPQSQTFPTAKTVRFECDLGGIPTPTVTWYKDGVMLHINGRIKQRGSSLVLSNTVTDDSGIYQCLGSSESGEVWEVARLLVNTSRNQPSPPAGVKCQAITPSAIAVSWDTTITTNIKAYTVHCLPTEGGEERQEVTVNNTYRVEKLRPFTNYTFYVRVYSGQSASDQSNRVVCRTREGVPIKAPIVRLQAEGPTSLRASWDLLRPEEALGQVTEHKIQWRKHEQLSANVDEVNGDVLEYTITGLSPGQKYDVRVLSATSQGWPDLGDDQNLRGPDPLRWFSLDMPSLGPSNSNVPLPPEVHLTVVNATSIEVTWTLPRENKVKPSGFRLSYRRQNDMLVGPVQLDGHVHQYLLTALDSQTQYEVQVQAVGAGDVAGGTGAKSIHTLVEGSGGGDSDMPGGGLVEPPSDLEAEQATPTSVRLKWKAPSTGGEAVSFYTVRYHPVQSALSVNASAVSYVRSTSLSVEVTDLKPFTVYEFQVRSHDAFSNQGPYSNKVECQTMEDVPGPPWNVQWKILNLTTVRVMWKEPLQANGILGSYRLYYTLDLSKPQEQWNYIDTVTMHCELPGLVANSRYSISVRASTQAGFGKATLPLTLTIPAVVGSTTGASVPPAPNTDPSQPDQRLWILPIAIATGLIAVIAMIGLVLTMRYAKSAHSPESSQCGAGARGRGVIHHSNGNGFYRASPHSSSGQQTAGVDQGGHHEELEFFAPMLFTGSSTNIPPAETSTTHLDTKGGYPSLHLNGTRAPLLGNGRVPNGHVTKPYHIRADAQLRITENPQFNSHSDAPRPLCSTCSLAGGNPRGVCTTCPPCPGSGEEPLLSATQGEDERWGDSTQLTNLTDDSLIVETEESERRARYSNHRNGKPPCA